MLTMATALLKAGVIEAGDLEQAEKRANVEADRLAAERRERFRYDAALAAMPGGLNYEMREWIDHNGPLPIDVLEQWGQLAKSSNGDGYRVVVVEWSKWLSVFRDHNTERESA